MPIEEDLVGTFTCEAKNSADVGESCIVIVNNPVAPLTRVDGANGQANGTDQSDYTYIAFAGGTAIVIMFVLTLLSIPICRKHYRFTGAKYNNSYRVGRTPGGRSSILLQIAYVLLSVI